MKLGQNITGEHNGIETLKAYETFSSDMGEVWFPTNSLATGMSEKKKNTFIEAIKNNQIVEMYFAIGKNIAGDNDIVYRGLVLDIKSDANSIGSPDKALTPYEWKDIENKIWIKIKNLTPITGLSSKDFIIASTGNRLSDVISKSQFHFGYIKRSK